jgi:signal peptidase subunit SPC25
VISTSTDKINPIYKVKVKYTTAAAKGSQNPEWEEKELKGQFGKWFSSDGYFVARPFQHFLASNIPIVGEADPKNAAEYVEPSQPKSSTAAPGAKLENFNVNIDNMGDILAAIDQQQGKASKSRRRG